MFSRHTAFVWIGIVLLSGVAVTLFSGQDCAAQSDPCDPDPCQGIPNAIPDTCTPVSGSCTAPSNFFCSCASGYSWQDATHSCRQDLSQCVDSDQDGYYGVDMVNCPHGDDCDDGNKDINPGVTEARYGGLACTDGMDNDCDTMIDAEDDGCQLETIDVLIPSTEYDGFEDGVLFNISGDINQMNWVGTPTEVQTGWVFSGVNIPKNSVVYTSYIRLLGFGLDGSATARLNGFAEDSAVPFQIDGSNRPSTRNPTAASVDWARYWPYSWEVFQTPDLSEIIQEIVDRPGWAAGNNLGMKATNPSGTGTNWAVCDRSSPNHSVTLHIEYLSPVPCNEEVCEGPPIAYESFYGHDLQLLPYEGANVALLIPVGQYHDRDTIDRIVTAIDAAYEYYMVCTGREPARTDHWRFVYNGKATIAVVPDGSTCGAGCGYLGWTGIELTVSTFDTLYYEVANYERYDQAVFYELGRNFWFYSDQLAYVPPDDDGSVVTGFAVFMRFKSMEAAGVEGAPFAGWDFDFFQQTVEDLIDLYLGDAGLNWENTLRIGTAPPNPLGLGGADLFASFLFRLESLYGAPFTCSLWHSCESLPARETTQDAVENFISAASAAANEDLNALFQAWKWPTP